MSSNSKILQILIQTISGQPPCPPLNHPHLTKEGLGVVDYQAICQLNPKLVGKGKVVAPPHLTHQILVTDCSAK
jgi:hypothetical protein